MISLLCDCFWNFTCENTAASITTEELRRKKAEPVGLEIQLVLGGFFNRKSWFPPCPTRVATTIEFFFLSHFFLVIFLFLDSSVSCWMETCKMATSRGIWE